MSMFATGIHAARIFVSMHANTMPLHRNLAAAEKRIIGFQSRIAHRTRRNAALLNSAFTGIPLTQSGLYGMGALFGGMQLFRATGNYERAMIGVRKTTNLSMMEVKALNTELVKLGTSRLSIPMAEIQEMAKVAGQAGLRGIPNLAGFVEQAGTLAMVTDLTPEMAAKNLAQIANVMKIFKLGPGGEKVLDKTAMGKMVAVINELENRLTADVPYIVNAMQKLAGGAMSIGIDTPELAATAAVLSEVGSKPEVGTTAIGKVWTMMRVSAPEIEKKAGLPGFEQQVKDDPFSAWMRFLKAYHEMNKQSGSRAFDFLKILKRRGHRVVETLNKLGETQHFYNRAIAIARLENKKGTSANIEAQKVLESYNDKVQLLKNSLHMTAVNIGNIWLPVMKDWVDSFRRWATALSQNESALKRVSDWTKIFVKMLATWAVFKAVKGVYDLAKAFFVLAASQQAASAAWAAGAGALGARAAGKRAGKAAAAGGVMSLLGAMGGTAVGAAGSGALAGTALAGGAIGFGAAHLLDWFTGYSDWAAKKWGSTEKSAWAKEQDEWMKKRKADAFATGREMFDPKADRLKDWETEMAKAKARTGSVELGLEGGEFDPATGKKSRSKSSRARSGSKASIVVVIQNLVVNNASSPGKVLKEVEHGILNSMSRQGSLPGLVGT